VGVFDERLMLCVGDARVGPTRQTFWAVWDRRAGVLREHTGWLRHRPVALRPAGLSVRGADVSIELEIEEVAGVETICSHGHNHVWTRKQGDVRARGTVELDGTKIVIDARGMIDDTVGYHARETSWFWAAGVGSSADGANVAFNLVAGVNDPERASERSVWVDGVSHEPDRVVFAPDLSRVHGGDLDLSFEPEAERARRDEWLLAASDYRQPFGRFSGSLGSGLTLRRGLGVMELHHARW
jgi:hypothetical protein